MHLSRPVGTGARLEQARNGRHVVHPEPWRFGLMWSRLAGGRLGDRSDIQKVCRQRVPGARRLAVSLTANRTSTEGARRCGSSPRGGSSASSRSTSASRARAPRCAARGLLALQSLPCPFGPGRPGSSASPACALSRHARRPSSGSLSLWPTALPEPPPEPRSPPRQPVRPLLELQRPKLGRTLSPRRHQNCWAYAQRGRRPEPVPSSSVVLGYRPRSSTFSVPPVDITVDAPSFSLYAVTFRL